MRIQQQRIAFVAISQKYNALLKTTPPLPGHKGLTARKYSLLARKQHYFAKYQQKVYHCFKVAFNPAQTQIKNERKLSIFRYKNYA